MENLKENAIKELSHVFGSFTYNEREVTKYTDYYLCECLNSKTEYKIPDLKTALEFLFPF